MKNARRFVIAGMALAAVAAMSGCGEQQQVISYQQGKYQGKPDTKPWENDPGASLYTASKWTKGDKNGWESALRSRSQNQNEYVHIGD